MLLATPVVAVAAASTEGPVSGAEVARLLLASVAVDARAGKVLTRAAAAYARLKTLEVRTRGGGLTGIAWMKRPRLLHCLQTNAKGERVALIICDGRRFYEYLEATRTWTERDAASLADLPLPLMVRPFFKQAVPGAVLLGLDGRPAVRELAFASLGERKLEGGPADGVRISAIIRGPKGEWLRSRMTRWYDRRTGLLARIEGGGHGQAIVSIPNAAPPRGAFRWLAPPGATRGFR